MPSFEKEKQVALQLAAKAGDIMLKYFDAEKMTESKGDDGPVTIADKQINSLVLDELTRHFPKDDIIAEEGDRRQEAARTWLCDPLDGTKSFIYGMPTAQFSLALAVNGQPQFGLLYDPFLNATYWAIRGKGGYCGSQRLRVSDQPLAGGIVATTSNLKRLNGQPYVTKLLGQGADPVAFSSGATYKMALLARGRIIGNIEAVTKRYDVAAAGLIVEEAGGKVTDWRGKPLDYREQFSGTIASNGVVHDQLLAAIM